MALAPPTAALVLRLRLMAPSVVPDPAMHTIYIIDPHDVFTRYGAVYAAYGRLREGARAGFLVPARLAYLAFGAVPGFLVTRYVLALVAVVPVYLLLRRCYGPPAGVVGILAVLSSPVIVTAWGTDYPDAAVVSYAAGALACLAMPCPPRGRRWWLATAGALLTLAVWSHGAAVPLAAATLAGYLGVRLVRERAGLPGDLTVLATAAAVATGLLVVASAAVIGDANFIGITWQAYRALSHQTATWHAATWRWAPYLTYLLVPPVVLGAFAVAAARRGRPVPVPLLVVGVVTAVQIVVYALLQFAGPLQILELHYFSSTLWAAVCLALAVTVAELSRPLSGHPLARWVPPAVLLAVPLAYEAYPHVPAFGWGPLGIILAAVAVGAAAVARGSGGLRTPATAATATGLALAVFVGAILVLTVAAAPRHRLVPGTSHDPPPDYATALGGSAALYFDSYRIITSMPGFVGQATYRGEQLMVWRLAPNRDLFIKYDADMYHAEFNSLYNQVPVLTPADRADLTHRRPAELLLLGASTAAFPRAVQALAAFQPSLARAGELRAGPLAVHAWLLRLGVWYTPGHAAG